jgi:hypothetical protein
MEKPDGSLISMSPRINDKIFISSHEKIFIADIHVPIVHIFPAGHIQSAFS